MPDPDQTYREALAEARARIVGDGGLGMRTVAEMRRALAQMLVDLQTDIDEGNLTPERAQELRQNIAAALQRFRDRAVVILNDSRQAAMQAAVQGHTQGLAAVLEQTGQAGSIAVAETFASVPEQVLEYGMTRRAIGGATTMQTLVNRNVQEVADDIDDTIESAIGRGVSNQRLAKDIAAQLASGDEELQQLMQEMGRTADADIDPDAESVHLTEEELSRAKRLEYDARRIAVSEINSHYDEADKIAAVQSPVVDLVRWKTSVRHDGLESSPDVCDVLENTDLQGYGEGIFHPATVPAHPHPHCMCRVETIMKDPEDYGEGNRDLPPDREISDTTVEEMLTEIEGQRTVTEAYVQNQTEMLQGHLDAARSVAGELV